ncbi:hypothetical protein SFRURICE_010821, partial [Spodoptera frugiperda]
MSLLEKQYQLLQELERLWENFNKDGRERKSKPEYFKKAWAKLDELWKAFQGTHEQICMEISQTDVYFTENYYEQAKEIYNKFLKAINAGYSRVSNPAAPGTSSEDKPEPFISNRQEGSATPQPQRPERGSYSRLDESLRKQEANFRAFVRTIANINIENMSEKWEFQDALKTLESRWTAIDNLHLEIDSELMGSNLHVAIATPTRDSMTSTSHVSQGECSEVLLATAQLKVLRADGQYHTFRALQVTHCDIIMLQLRHAYTELKHNNKVLLNDQLSARTRTKRGLINGVGYLANTLFGVLDDRFSEQYEKDITQVRENQKHLTQLWKNQTSVMEAEYNLLKRTEEAVKIQHKTISKHLLSLEQTSNVLAQQISTTEAMTEFTLSAMAANNLLNHLRNIQETLLDTITSIHHGRLNIHLIDPIQFQNELSVISGQLSQDLTLPIDNIQTNMQSIYNLLRVRAKMTKNYLIFEIIVPLISTENYDLYHIIPVPHRSDESMLTVIPIESYVAVNLQKDAYLPVPENELEHCIIRDPSTYLWIVAITAAVVVVRQARGRRQLAAETAPSWAVAPVNATSSNAEQFSEKVQVNECCAKVVQNDFKERGTSP